MNKYAWVIEDVAKDYTVAVFTSRQKVLAAAIRRYGHKLRFNRTVEEDFLLWGGLEEEDGVKCWITRVAVK